MIPVLTSEDMAAVDAAAQVGEAVLIGRAGWAVARAAKRMLGGTYGRHVVVVAGKGNNGADGRVAAEILRRRGAQVVVVDAGTSSSLPTCDLVIDAAFGTGFRGEYVAPDTHDALVLAVDIPSGVVGNTGEVKGRAMKADRTVTFAALKPGLLYGAGVEHAGQVELVDIGLDVSGARVHVVETQDVLKWLPKPDHESHKWQTSVLVVAGSPGMHGAAVLSAQGASHAGAGMVHLAIPGVSLEQITPTEVITHGPPAKGWDTDVLELQARMRALVIGPGLGRSDETMYAVIRVIEQANIPIVVDADALVALGEEGLSILTKRTAPTILTPHDGEYRRLTGSDVGHDRVAAARSLAAQTNAVVLLKGSTSTVAHPDGRVLLAIEGDARLATAGTGDVLSGITGAFLAMGVDPFFAVAAGAHVHGSAAKLGSSRGFVAPDLPMLVARWLSVYASAEIAGYA